MNKADVITFFDSVAPLWDADMIKPQRKVDRILDIAEVFENTSVLDIACGTGVLVPDYKSRNVKKYTGIDISKNMIEIAVTKFLYYDNFNFLCGDAEAFEFSEKFDTAVIYNAFPHFVDSDKLFANTAKYLVDGGRITIAHSMSREDLIKHHSGNAKHISNILPEITEMKELLKPYLIVDTCISNKEIYVISGRKYDADK